MESALVPARMCNIPQLRIFPHVIGLLPADSLVSFRTPMKCSYFRIWHDKCLID